MADVESSSAAMQQPPSSTSNHLNSIPLLAAADLMGDNSPQVTIQLQQPQQQQQPQAQMNSGILGGGISVGIGPSGSQAVATVTSPNATGGISIGGGVGGGIDAATVSASGNASAVSSAVVAASGSSASAIAAATASNVSVTVSSVLLRSTSSSSSSAGSSLSSLLDGQSAGDRSTIVGGGAVGGIGVGGSGCLNSSEPPAKKLMLDNRSSTSTSSSSSSSTMGSSGLASAAVPYEKLEYRLGGILCCAVCLDLPKTAMYQCQMGHLMCAACFTHLLADGRLRDQIATCPNCRVEISKNTASRNLAVEKAASELPSECQYCNREFPYKSLDRHEQFECQERPTNCKYTRIGCQWRGPFHEATEHERNCLHPSKSGYEVMAALEAHDAKVNEEKKMFSTLIDLLSYEKIIFNDLQMKPYRTDEYVHKLFYETARFSAFNHQWVVKARINNSQRDPHQSNERQITYQLILKTKTSSPMNIHFFALKGPFSDMKVLTQIYKHDFSENSTESDYHVLPLPDSSECNRLLSNKSINFRLLMFLLSK